MLRITPSTSAAGAKAYYSQALCHQDYYSEKQEIPGQWHGRVAELMQLTGAVTREQFAALCDNRHPVTVERLTPRTKSNRRVGYDFTFNAPKSVSVLYALSGDERIAEAVREAANATMREIEQEIGTRVRAGGENGERKTGNLLWADFLHTTSRPVDGIPDPHLHVHAYAFNVTYDPVELRYKAAEFGSVKADGPYFEAAFHARLAKALAELGYGVARGGRYMAVAGVPETVTLKFSRRTAEIEAEAGKRGITGEESRGKLKATLGALTRRGKGDITLDTEQLADVWRSRLDAHERAAMAKVMAGEGSGDGERVSPSDSLAYALAHSFERQSVADEKDVLTTALQRGFGQVTPEQVKLAAQMAPLMRREKDGRRIVTTREVYDEEQAMLRFAREGRGVYRPLGPREHTIGNPALNRDQLGAVVHLLSSRDRVTLIRGGAGTGKTTLLKEAVAGIETGGKKVFAFAPTASASRGVLQQEGFAGAETVWQLLNNKELRESVRDQVILIDEAGLMSARDMARVFALASEANARVILVGDSKQHSSVARGDALRLLEQKAGIRPAEVLDIVRQRGAYREAVSAISHGEVAEGFRRLERMGCITEAPGEERYRQLVADYLAAVNTGKSVLVVAPTHREAEHVTALLREGLKASGRIGREETPVKVLKSLDLTEAQAGDPKNYKPGYMLRFHQNARGIKRGETLEVAHLDRDGFPVLRSAEGKLRAVPLEEAWKFTVYRPKTIRLSSGDTIRLNQNGFTADRKHRLSNGGVYEVKRVEPDGAVTLAGGWQLAPGFGGFTHGYVSTSHGSQGRTVDQVFIAQDSFSGRASSTEQFYVSVSRGRQAARIYTDDKEALATAVQRSAARPSATELMRGAFPAHANGYSRHDWVKGLTMRLNRTLDQLAEAAAKARMPGAELLQRAREASIKAAQEFARERGQDAPAR